MEKDRLIDLINGIKNGLLGVDEVASMLSHMPFEDLACAKFDHHRPLRNGFQEVIFCEGKSEGDIIQIISGAIPHKSNLLATRLSREKAEKILKAHPDANYDDVAKTLTLLNRRIEKSNGTIAIVSAGTADASVAMEAHNTLKFYGVEAEHFNDVGIAGLHRVVHFIERIRKHDVVIVIAGMEGALPSVLGGLIRNPIIAVPTSIGYGTNLKGFTALLAMLNSCAEGITVVNIDNGFGAACAALRIIGS